MSGEWLGSLEAWVVANPLLAYSILFALNLLESVAVFGLFMPGAAVLFIAGALVAFDVMSLQAVWIVCAGGGFIGDLGSYLLGRRYHDTLRRRWPFNRYPELFARSETFFVDHGAKSVFAARFIGPLRPMIPVTAGMLAMPATRFVPVSFIACALCAPVYLLPGITFGASMELAAAVAGRLALLIGLLLAVAWASIWLVGWLNKHLTPRASHWLAMFFRFGRRHPLLRNFTSNLVDPSKPESGSLLALSLVLLLATVLAAWQWPLTTAVETNALDAQFSRWLLSLRSVWSDALMGAIATLNNAVAVLSAALAVWLGLARRRRWLAAMHWLAAIVFGVVLSALVTWAQSRSSTLITDLTRHWQLGLIVTAAGFFAVLVARELPHKRRVWPYWVAVLVTILTAMSAVYFDGTTLTAMISAVAVATVWVVGLGIAYRRRVRRAYWSLPAALLFYGVWLAVGTAQLLFDHARAPTTPNLTTQTLPQQRWQEGNWCAGFGYALVEPVPPRWQLATTPDAARSWLVEQGWQPPAPVNAETILRALAPDDLPITELPLMPRGLLGAAPVISLVRPTAQANRLMVFRAWPSGYMLPSGEPVLLVDIYLYEAQRRWRWFQWLRRTSRVQDPERWLPADIPALASPTHFQLRCPRTPVD